MMDAYPSEVEPRIALSAKLVAAIRLHHLRAYQIAHKCGVHPSTLSKLLNGIERPAQGDARVLRLAAFVGVPLSEAFELERPV